MNPAAVLPIPPSPHTPYPTTCLRASALWCERQVHRIFAPLPSDQICKEILIRAAIIVSIVIPLFALFAKILCRPASAAPPRFGIDRSVAVPHPAPVMQPPPVIPPDRIISDGYGEYVLRFRGNPELLDLDLFTAASNLLEKFQPQIWMKEHLGATNEDRLQTLQQELHQIDPRLQTIFIPKTLFELFFIRQTIAEDADKIKNYPYQDPENPTEEELEEVRGLCYSTKNSWLNFPQAEFKELRIKEKGNEAPALARLNEIAHRFNGAWQTLFNEKGIADNLSMKQIEELVEEQIKFIQEKTANAEPFGNCNKPTPLSHFCSESNRGSLCSMKLADEAMINILRHAVHLESSKEAQGKTILYRGGILKDDYPIINRRDTGESCYSLSLGESPFSGIVYDTGATAFHFMRTRKRDAYALLVDPQNPEDQNLFFAPRKGPLKALFLYGEFFHGRTKAYVMNPNERIFGYNGICSTLYGEFPYKSALPKDRFTALFQEKMNQGYLLKAAVA